MRTFVMLLICSCFAAQGFGQSFVISQSGDCPGGMCAVTAFDSGYQLTVENARPAAISELSVQPTVKEVVTDFTPVAFYDFTATPRVMYQVASSCPQGVCSVKEREVVRTTQTTCNTCPRAVVSVVSGSCSDQSVYRVVQRHAPVRHVVRRVGYVSTAPIRFFQRNRPVRSFFGSWGTCCQ